MDSFAIHSVDFALDLFKQISDSSTTLNSFMSPASITLALAMTYAGADGKTKEQMSSVMFTGISDDQVFEKLSILVNNLMRLNDDDYTIRVANRAYADKSFSLLQTYLDDVEKYYKTTCLSVDFKSNAGTIANDINKWVAEVTNEKIHNLLENIEADTRLLLVNAIYFNGNWKHQFSETKTEKKPFHISDTATIDVDMMHAQMKDFNYCEDEKCQVLSIPFKSSDIGIFFLLPKDSMGLEQFEKELTAETLLTYFNTVKQQEVDVQLPKFKMEQSFNLKQALSKLGMSDMFQDGANFSKLTDCAEYLSVSDVIHKAFIEVNENGAEAAASTCIKIRKRCAIAEPEPVRFIANHPFLFTIVELASNSILFLGNFYGQ